MSWNWSWSWIIDWIVEMIGRCFKFILMFAMLTLSVSCKYPGGISEDLPAPELPDAFSATGHTLPPDQWWLTFNDPVLNPLIETALSDNLTLQAVWERLNQAKAQAIGRKADFWPQLNASAQAQKQNSEQDNETAYSFGLSAAYEVDLWGRVRAQAESAALEVKASETALQAAAITLSASVAESWYELTEQRGQKALLLEQMQINQTGLTLINARFRVGKAFSTDVLQQRQLIAQTQKSLALVEANLAVLAHELAVLLGKATVALPETFQLADLPPLPAAGLPAELLQRRPDVLEAFYRLQAARADVAEAIAQRYPSIDLGAALNTVSSSAGHLFENWFESLTVNLVAPLFDAGARAANVDSAQAIARSSWYQYQQTVLQAVQEVEDALARENYQTGYINQVSTELNLSREVVDGLRLRYTQGNLEYQDVLNALIRQQQLERDLLSARLDLLKYRIALLRALAGGWPMVRTDSE